jgi:hypothetical protein
MAELRRLKSGGGVAIMPETMLKNKNMMRAAVLGIAS